MKGILAYGSLVNREACFFEAGSFDRAVPVRVRGYRRLFNQKAFRRIDEGAHNGVLNVERARQYWINALCLLVGNDEEASLEIKRRDYKKVYVCSRDIACYPGHALPEDLVSFIYVGNEENSNGEVLPNQAYLGRCIDEAANWGDIFFMEFVRTTYLASGVPLREYLSEKTR